MLKWQEEYMNWLNEATNEEILDDYSYYVAGDDYDGCFTKQGEWKFKKVNEEFCKRLIKC